MRFDIITTFPEMVAGPLCHSILGKAIQSGKLNVHVHNLRVWTNDKHHKTDDTQFGGGDGMVMLAEPIIAAVEDQYDPAIDPARRCVVVMTPQGKQLTQSVVHELVNFEQIIIVCGHYKGIDERVIEYLSPKEISIGDYVLTGGEIPAVVLVDALARFVPGIVKELGSVQNDSFYDGLLDCPRYTRPRTLRDLSVPEVLLSGDHNKISEWRRTQALRRTKKRRPDLYSAYLSQQQGAE